jgi:hypothetical protein
MSWVAVGTAAVGVGGKIAAGSTSGASSPAAMPAGDFFGGNTGDFSVNKPALTQTTIWVIVGALATVIIVWLLRKKK